MGATDFYSMFEGDLGSECVIIPMMASGAVHENMVALYSAAAAANSLLPTVIESATNDSAAVAGVFAADAATGTVCKVIKFGRAKVKITCSTVAIAVGDLLASDNGGGAKEAAAATLGIVFAKALHAATTQNDEIACFVNTL
jgi:regulator of RNase E activity RraA